MAVLLAACRRHGVVPGIHCRTTETVNRRIAEGWPLVGMVNDQRYLVSAAQAARDAVKTDR
jgi:2-keto-3-deoxy-L-rhamnonate aldolase RhmA